MAKFCYVALSNLLAAGSTSSILWYIQTFTCDQRIPGENSKVRGRRKENIDKGRRQKT